MTAGRLEALHIAAVANPGQWEANDSLCEAEIRRFFVPDDELERRCRGSTRMYWPRRADAAPRVVEFLKQRLLDRHAASLVRVGDGEGNALGHPTEPSHSFKIEFFQHRFESMDGSCLSESEALEFCARVREALFGADFIGFRCFDGLTPESKLLFQRHAAGDLMTALGILHARAALHSALLEGRFVEKCITSAWIHLALIPFLDEIVRCASRLVVITGRGELRPQFESRYGARLAAFIEVPVEGTVPSSPERSHYRAVFPAVLRLLGDDWRGALVLVGAGFFGKLYCDAARDSGAVAVDLGSAFDILAGLTTRPVHRPLHVEALRWC